MSTPTPTQASPSYAEFQAGVTAALRSWSALREAVEQEWGGSESAAKAEDLRANILIHFDGASAKPRMTLEDLEDNLLAYMEEEFGVVLEDGSERELSDLIWRMYEGCASGDVTLARGVVQNAVKAEEALKAGNVKSVIQSGGDGGDDMDDDSDCSDVGGAEVQAMSEGGEQQPNDTINSNSSVALTYTSGTLFGGPPKPTKELPPPRQMGEAAPEKPSPVLDDDGFAPVVSKRKGKKNG